MFQGRLHFFDLPGDAVQQSCELGLRQALRLALLDLVAKVVVPQQSVTRRCAILVEIMQEAADGLEFQPDGAGGVFAFAAQYLHIASHIFSLKATNVRSS